MIDSVSEASDQLRKRNCQAYFSRSSDNVIYGSRINESTSDEDEISGWFDFSKYVVQKLRCHLGSID